MNTDPKHTAEQLRLVASILETGHPWEVWTVGRYEPPEQLTLMQCLERRHKIRLALATPPDNRPLHNPDNLDAEKVGAGYRLVCYDDNTHADKLEKWAGGEWVAVHTIGQLSFRHCQSTYRLPLSVPWPEPKPDPYAKLKAAHAAGKVIQRCNEEGHWLDYILPEDKAPLWFHPAKDLCIKPEEPFQLPPPPPGIKWHREDGWKQGDLPPGYRPYVQGETLQKGDEWKQHSDKKWQVVEEGDNDIGSPPSTSHPFRTRRPLTFEHEGKTWTWHRPGDPMPCDGTKLVIPLICYDGQYKTGGYMEGAYWNWNDSYLVGWRYAEPETKEVELGPEDVKPFTVIRRKGEAETWHWRTVSYVDAVKVTCGNRGYGWAELASDYEHNESLPLAGKWNPDAWEPCKKTVTIEKP